MLEKQYIIRGNNVLYEPCLVKISYGPKYVIAKCKLQSATLKNIEDSVNSYMRGGKNNPNGLYYFLNEYVRKHPGEEFKVETILVSENPYRLLVREQKELEAGRKSKASPLLNNQVEAYLPAYNEEKRMYGGWIRPIDVVNFRNWMKKHKKELAAAKRKKAKKKGSPKVKKTASAVL